MGINIGAAAGPLVCGWLEIHDWHYGFAAAGVGMLAGLIQFRLMRADLGDAGRAPASPPSRRLKTTASSVVAGTLTLALLLLAAGVNGWIVFDAPALARGTALALVAAAVVYFGYVFLMGKLRVERNRVIVIVVLVIACAIFWTGYEQAGSSLNLSRSASRCATSRGSRSRRAGSSP